MAGYYSSAAKAKSCVVATNAPMSGVEDYLINNETGLVSENDFNSFLNNVELLIRNKILRLKFGETGRDKILSLGDRKENMKKFINLVEKW